MNTLTIFNGLKPLPLGKRVFTFLVCQRLPYFRSIKPRVLELEAGRSVVQMKERRSVHNHLRTVHAIALCNLCELSMAMTTEATIPGHLRYIPVGMTVEYKKKAKGTLRAISEARVSDFKVGKTDIHVDVYDEANVNVMSAVISLDIKEKGS